MEAKSEYPALVANRENLYRFLARLYKVEVDQALLERMMGMSFPEDCGEEELASGYRMLGAYLRCPGQDPLTDLAVDYAKVFLGAGGAKNGFAAFPYESVYTSPERLIMQEARDQVVAAYRSEGLDKVEALDVPEDHVALELEFMACLCGETRAALARGDRGAVLVSLANQKDFLTRHLLNWVPAFCADIPKCADTDFYKAVAKLTSGYLRLEQAIIEEQIDDSAAHPDGV
ncbi:molecular chaperone TorD family protein [Telmatospirillum sp.]|uniref:TorD/DmsD family molecular chaperone n=1 Tax=Telmatospirillum sp. TaxID=2079197 RepID=UPI002850434D|nr:molecular chaperone TorD family protein [Telmatospirillum sp.]MDR3437920.1 molecular chaperone TorD family protein [Telmatospirillum sp.]